MVGNDQIRLLVMVESKRDEEDEDEEEMKKLDGQILLLDAHFAHRLSLANRNSCGPPATLLPSPPEHRVKGFVLQIQH